MLVHIPAALWTYTKGASQLDVTGKTLADVLAALDARFPGLRFRIIDEQDQIRTHILLYINEDKAASLAAKVRAKDEITIVCSLSGG